jgi:hypothetical protein
MSEVKMDRTIRAYLECGTTLNFSDADDAKVFANPWGDAPIVKAVERFDDIEDPVGRLFQKAELNAGQVPQIWEEPITPASFEERSQGRLEKMSGVIDRIFANYPQERQEAIEIARRALADARAEAGAIAAA